VREVRRAQRTRRGLQSSPWQRCHAVTVDLPGRCALRRRRYSAEPPTARLITFVTMRIYSVEVS